MRRERRVSAHFTERLGGASLRGVIEVIPLRRDAYVVRMERLWPAETSAASAFCAALGIANDTGYQPPTAGPEVAPDAPDLAALRVRLHALLARGRSRRRLWAGSDVRV